MSINCWHPLCDKSVPPWGHVCKKHWGALNDELRNALKRLNRHGQDTEEIRSLVEDYFAERVLGDHEITTCRGSDCGAEIIWMQGFRRDGSSYRVPVNAETVSADDVDFERNRHTPHWKTCPNADEFRRGRQL